MQKLASPSISHQELQTMRTHRVVVTLLTLQVLTASNAFGQQAYQILARDLHNQYRAKHGSPAMTLDNNLNALAEKCAVYYAQKKTIDHSCPYKNGAGENLVGGAGTWTQSQFAQMSTKMWYDEVSAYDYNNPGFSMATGHFTQVVWKSSTKLGFGATTIGGYTVGVCLYSAPGNYQGQFPANVLRPR
jgi:glioma pathogenesis-related protein 2